MAEEYKKSLDDEVDWKVIDQLHAATSNFSTMSLEVKKMLLILIGIAIPSLIKLSKDKLDLSLFLVLYFLIVMFWLLDSLTYYYQEKLREGMNVRFNNIKDRNKNEDSNSDAPDESIALPINRTSKDRVWRSIKNPMSLIFYLFLLSVTSLGLVLFLTGTIK